jgi:uncharacterized repeat protein (TIGR03837 family)
MPSGRTWDIFCTAVDNYGDIGVCWRLARQLAAEHGLQVRLWIDDLASFHNICPAIVPGREMQHCSGVEVGWWREPFPAVIPAEVVVEAFACNPPPGYVAAMAASAVKPAWINLEFLSAEAWVRGCHGLPSPHPSLPLTKHFFFPGFVAGTGGLLIEQGLAQRRDAFRRSAGEQARLWQALQLPGPRAGELQVSMFCYPQNALAGLLRVWAEGNMPVRCLVPDGIAAHVVAEVFGGSVIPAGTLRRTGSLEVAVFPFLEQDEYDRLLWACDLNFVRGEDSFVRAQWAARPMVWQIYPQRDGAHWPKLQAFLELHGRALPAGPRAAVAAFWQAWNKADESAVQAAWPNLWMHKAELEKHALVWAEELTGRGNLANGLVQFAENLLK